MRPLDRLSSIKLKLGVVIVATVAVTAVVLAVGHRAGLSLPVRTLLAAGIGLLLVQGLARGMTSPLREMAAASSAMARGDYSRRVRATSRDEVGELARAFNTMAAELADVERGRRELVANVSHELRTPLGALHALLENLADGVEPPDPRTLRVALAQTERLGRLVAQLLDLSRMESGGLPLRPERFGVRELLETVTRECTLGELYERHPVWLRVEVQPGDLVARADPERLYQVVANLLDNAVRHSPADGRVWLSAHEATAGLTTIAVADEGPGIPDEETERVFERFHRLDGARAARDGGSGLGLAIARWIVDAHGGAIRAERREPHGLPDGRGAAPVSAEHPPLGRPEGAAPEPGTRGGATPGGGARWLAPAALVLAVVAAATLPGRPAGLGLALLGVALCAVGAWGAGVPDRWSVAWWLAAGALSAVAGLRSAAWVVVLSVLGATALAALGAAGEAGWRDVTTGAFGVPRQLVPGAFEAGRRLQRAAAPVARGRAGGPLPALRGALLAAVLLAVFVPLFLAADAAFAELASGVVRLDLGVSQPVWRIALAVLILSIAGALWRLGARRRARPPRPPGATLGRTECLIAITALDLLFGAFVLVQITTLFGGDEHVLRTAGLTYAEYARQGFAQLEVVAALTLAVIAAATRWGPPGDRLLRALLAALCVLTLVVLASALKRLGLYEHAFGFTRLRFLVHAQLLWLGGLFLALLAAGAARRTTWLPRATVALSAAAALLFAAADPDRWIAERNADRYERTGRIDVAYLRELSPDAAPVLDRLPKNLTECLAESLRAQVDGPDGIAGANHGRARARRALTRVPADVVCNA